MQRTFPGVRRVVGALAFLFLCACSGGGNGDSARQIGLSTTALTFNASSPSDATPESQVITATFSEGVANLAALHTGPAIERVDVALNGTSAQLTVVPAAPQTLGSGAFRGTIAITAYFCGDSSCSRLEAGATQTVNTHYQVSPVVNEIAPTVAISGASAFALIRGVGFQGFSVQGVTFGATPATEFEVSNNNEIRARYPALAAGSYPVTLDIPTHTGAITSNATLVVVDPVVHTEQAVAWPSPVGAIYSLEYDILRGALLVGTDAGGGQLARFPSASGALQAPATVSLPNLRDAALSSDLSQWLAINTTGVVHANPATLALAPEVAAPSLPANSFLKSIAVVHSSQAIITTGIAESATTPLYFYAPRTGELAQGSLSLNNATARGSANGATIGLIQGDPSLTSAPAFYVATAAGALSATTIALNQNAVPPAFDRDSTRFVLNGTRVFNSDLSLWGTLPDTTAGVVLHPNGTRAYTYDTAASAVLVFDISETRNGEAYAALGDPVTLAAQPGSGVRMAISPDGNTLFIAGTTQLVVEPTPAL